MNSDIRKEKYMEYPNNNLNNNFNNMNNNVPNGAAPKKSGKAGLIVLIIFLLLVIVALVVLFVFKEKIFPVSSNTTPSANTTTSNTIENTTFTTNTINENAQSRLIDSVKGYWIASTGDLFLSITDTTDSSGNTSTNFSLTGGSGVTSAPCTIDSNRIKCGEKVYEYKVQGNNLILSYDNVTRNFTPSNYYQLSKQSKKFYANMMGYSITPAKLPDDFQITGDYTNKALVGTWSLTGGNGKYIFSIVDGNLTATSINTLTNESTLNIPVGMDKKYIEFVDNSSLNEEIYSYQLLDNNTLQLRGVTNKTFAEYKREQ
jgi:hypothetical protein